MPTRRRFALIAAFTLSTLASPHGVRGQTVTRVVPTRVTPVSPRDLFYPTESPDGRFIAADGDSGTYEFDRRSNRWTRLTDDVAALSWSPTGRFLAFSRRDRPGGGFRVWILPIDPKTGGAAGAERRVSVQNARRFAWSPNGKSIALVAMDSGLTKIWTQAFNGGDERLVARVRGGTADPPAWSPDGKSIYVTTGQGEPGYVARVAVATGNVDSLRLLRGLIGVSPDGRYLAQTNPFHSTILISSTTDGREVARVVVPPRVKVFGWSASAPGQLFGLESPIHEEIHSVSLADGSIRALVSGDSIYAGGPRLSPDGKRLLYTVGTQLMVSAADGADARVIKTANEVDPQSAEWSSDGTHIAYLSTDPAELHVVDMGSGRDARLASLQDSHPLGGKDFRFVWRHDGQALRYTKLLLSGSNLTSAVHEVTLTGHDSVLADFPTSPPGVRPEYFLTDTVFVRRTANDWAALNLNTLQWKSLAPARAGEAKLSQDGRTLAFGDWPNPNTDDAVLRIVEGSSDRTIRNPFGGEVSQPFFFPDKRNVIVAICATCESGPERRSLVLMPLNGDPPRVLSEKEGRIMDWETIAFPGDGRSILYDPELAWQAAVVHIPVNLSRR